MYVCVEKSTFLRLCVKKTVSFFVILFFTIFALPTNSSAQAQVPVIDSLNLFQNTIVAEQTIQQTVKEFSLDQFGWHVAKIVIQEMTQSIVNWINRGFEGDPGFITNPEAFLRHTGDVVAGEFIEEIGLGFLCDPFSIEIQAALLLDHVGGSYLQHGCTLTDVVENFEGFVDDGDFSQGGWGGWFALTQNSNNNPYGSYLNSKAELGIRIQTSQGLILRELDWGSGFFSFKDGDGNVTTPGVVIENQLENVLGSGVRQLELADEFNEIIGALVGQLAKQVLGGGISGGLRTSSAPSYAGSRSYIDQLGADLTNQQGALDAVAEAAAIASSTAARVAAQASSTATTTTQGQ
jgi:hypothetical protein